MFVITLSLVLLLLLCVIILFYSYHQHRPAALSRFDHFKQLYNNCLSGEYKNIDICAKVVTKADEVVFFGKLFNRPHPPMRPMLTTVFHDNRYEDWQCARKTLVRNILAPKAIRSLGPMMSECAAEVTKRTSPAVVLDVVRMARLYMNKIMYRCVFGGNGQQKEEEDFSYWSSKLRHEESELLKGTNQRMDGVQGTAAELYFKKLIWSSDTSEESLLSKLKAFSPTSDYVESNSVSFILGGFTSCVSACVFVLYELAARPDLQEALRASPVPDRLFTLVVKEGLRKYPPFSSVIKTEASHATSWILPVSGIHHDCQVYPEPSEFLPGRDYPRNMFCSFGVGLRKCPGEHFSYSVVEIFLKHMIGNFKITRIPNCDRVLKFSETKFTTTVKKLELIFEGL